MIKGIRKIRKIVRVWYDVQLKCGHIKHIGYTKPKKLDMIECAACDRKVRNKQNLFHRKVQEISIEGMFYP